MPNIASPNVIQPSLGSSLANTGFSKPEPGFLESAGGFGGLTSGIRNVTRNLAAGFAKDPAYRQMAAQQLQSEQQMQQQQAAEIQKAVIQASLDSLGQLAESVRGIGSQSLMGSPSTLQMIERAANNVDRALSSAGWPEEQRKQMVEQYKWQIMAAADMPAELSPEMRKLEDMRKAFPDATEAELKEGAFGVEPRDAGTKPVYMNATLPGGKVVENGLVSYDNGMTFQKSPTLLEGGDGQGGGYFDRLAQYESAGGTNTTNPLNPNVTGKFQIDRVKSWPQLEGVDDDAAIKVVANTNAADFRKRFKSEPTDTDQYGMHRLGAEGYAKLLAADPNAPIEDVAGDVVVEDNPDLAGKTVLQVRQMFTERMGTGTTWKGGGETDLSRFAKEDKPPAQSAAEAEIERFQKVLGLTPEEAVKLQSGVYRVTAPDANNNISVIDMTTMKTVKTVNPTAELLASEEQAAPTQPAEGESFKTPIEEEVLKGTGGIGALQKFFGSTIGQFLSGEEFPETQEATRNIRAFNNAARKLIAQGITTGSDRLSNQEQFWSMELLPDPDGWLVDPASEARKIPVLRENMSAQMDVITKALKNPQMTSAQRASLTDYQNTLSLLIKMMGPAPDQGRAALESEIEALTAKPAGEWTPEDTKRAEEILKELGSGE